MSTSSVTSAAAKAAQDAATAVQQAAQSLISSSTGSTVDVNSLVSALATAKTAGPAALITAQAGEDEAQISSLATLSAAMSGLQAAIGPFLSGNALSSTTATLSGAGITAKTASGASGATYQINTTQFAQSQSITSGSFSQADSAAMGSGTLVISLGSGSTAKSFQVTVDPSNDSLQDIANDINSESGNPGVKALVINGANGQSLSLQSTSTGSSSMISVDVQNATSSTSPISQLEVTSSVTTDSSAPVGSSTVSSPSGGWTQSQAAQDARLTINNQLVTSSTNTISGAIPGVTLTLDPTNAKAIGQQTLTVAPDHGSVESELSSFVTAYNAVINQLNSLAAPNVAGTSGTGGTLLGDEMINQIGASLSGIAGGAVSSGGIAGTLASLGISLQVDTATNPQPFAQLQIDADANSPTLDDAVTNNPALISALFNDTNGIAQQLDSMLTAYTSPDKGIIQSRTDALTADITSLSKQQDDLDDYKAVLMSQYNDQFTALDTLMAQAQTNQNYLTALFGGSNSSGALAQNNN
ncbi:flagellar filament capping protein FliD [Paraburkholderia edwinii]|uniref:Flagellar hook-associated protein 2 n=1 Tax=Paraburkholderia edwinii TaxID=2861782 RepID=A0ABX8UY23_9BURK|nr:flagellar filament capping protein FliD [Paraburkholderia edwinii]QYD72140.1 flagellar filament capping protein FliD [Paraburkholderia edwinii]